GSFKIYSLLCGCCLILMKENSRSLWNKDNNSAERYEEDQQPKMQIAGEILACGDENIREAGEISDQVLFAVRFISTHVTFYKAEIPEKYWNELSIGLPDKYSVAIKRWPGENKKLSGLDLADPEGRIAVLTALTKIRQFLL
ncbi:14855_t:CDS:2, partial [Cetraspora pellucida]